MEDVTKKLEKTAEEETIIEKVKAYLVVKKREDIGKIIEVKAPTSIIGRNYGNIIVKDEMVSRKHAQIDFLSKDTVYIKDLASTNGTLVNGQKISYEKLKDGDLIKVGSTIFEFHLKKE